MKQIRADKKQVVAAKTVAKKTGSVSKESRLDWLIRWHGSKEALQCLNTLKQM